MRKKYRGVEYDVHRSDNGRWQWTVYPDRREGIPFGDLVENEVEAQAACRAEIDAGLEEPRLSARVDRRNSGTWLAMIRKISVFIGAAGSN